MFVEGVSRPQISGKFSLSGHWVISIRRANTAYSTNGLLLKQATFTHQLKVVHVLGKAEKDIQFEICAQIGFEQEVITLYDRLRRYGFQDRMFGEMYPYGDGGLHGSGLFLHS